MEETPGRRFETPPPPRPLAERVSMSQKNIPMNASATEFEPAVKVESPPPPPLVSTPRMSYSEDPLVASAPYYLQKTMNLKPASFEHIWLFLQTAYRNDPSKFIIISTPHQNHPTDLFHMSVEYREMYYTTRLHINGYYKSGFIVTSVEYTLNCNKTWSDAKTIATFTLP